MKRSHSGATWLIGAALLLAGSIGCERPPRAETTENQGPPTVTHVDPESPEGKALTAARRQPHDNFAPAPAAQPAAGSGAAVPAGQPATSAPQSGAAPAPGATRTPDKTPEGKQRVTAASEAQRKADEFGTGIVATPLATLGFARSRLNSLQVEDTLKVYVVEHGKPHDTTEFMEKVIKASGLTLPALPVGERYVYDPDSGPDGTLMIERPTEGPK